MPHSLNMVYFTSQDWDFPMFDSKDLDIKLAKIFGD